MKTIIFSLVMLSAIVFAAGAEPLMGGTPAPFAGEASLGIAIMLNLLPSFGAGSFYQGDSVGGTVIFVGDVLAVACLVVPIAWWFGQLFLVVLSAITWQSYDAFDVPDWIDVLLYTALGIAVADRVFGVIRAVWYDAEQRWERDKSAVSAVIVPIFRPAAGRTGPGFGIGARLSWAL
jgi:hypothetical protein